VFELILRSATSRTSIDVLSLGATSLAILAGGMMHWSLGVVSEATVLVSSLALACSSFIHWGAYLSKTVKM
jgi:hypothetical protein